MRSAGAGGGPTPAAVNKLDPRAPAFVPASRGRPPPLAAGPRGRGPGRRRAGNGRRPPRGQAGGGGPRTNEGNIRRTVYICDIDQAVTEELLGAVFGECGATVDVRVCGDPNSANAMRFAFIEFEEEAGARSALNKNGTVLGLYPLRVLPSRTAIVPVNTTYLPQSQSEQELTRRTIYAANIDRKVDRADVKAFFETLCGRVSKLRLLGDHQHATRIAFVEFAQVER